MHDWSVPAGQNAPARRRTRRPSPTAARTCRSVSPRVRRCRVLIN